MRVTIITACYNRAATIGEAIESVAGQTYPDIEHIVVDGGSSDGTLDVVARYRSVGRLIPGPDKGVYDALNKGIAAASGELIGFLHSDDVYANAQVIERVAVEMKARSLDALYGDVAFVRADDLSRIVRVYSSRRFRPSRISWGWMPAHPGLFLRRKLFQDYGVFRTDYTIAGDFEFVARIFSRQNLRHEYLPEVLVKMRLGGISTRGWRSTLTLNREVLRACRQNGIPSNYLKILSKYPAKLLEFLVR
jgi:glycosyltransferase involved in cell wall biosynthesis